MNRPTQTPRNAPQTPRRDDDRDRLRSSPTKASYQQAPVVEGTPDQQAYTGSGNGEGFGQPAPQTTNPNNEYDRDVDGLPRQQHFVRGDESTYGRGNPPREPEARKKLRH